MVDDEADDGKVAIVTGAAGGLGRGTVSRLADEGWPVHAVDLDPSVVEANPGAVAGHVVDVSDAAQVQALVDAVVDRHGRLDVMFNNAGVVQPMVGVANPEILDQYRRVFDVNFAGVLNGVHSAARVMVEQGSGAIVNTASYYGHEGVAHFGVYCASKAAVISLTQAAAKELGPHGITVNAICPGNMATDMHWSALTDEAELSGMAFEDVVAKVRDSIPLKRHGTAEDIAGALVWLASSDSSYVTGNEIYVSGGVFVG